MGANTYEVIGLASVLHRMLGPISFGTVPEGQVLSDVKQACQEFVEVLEALE